MLKHVKTLSQRKNFLSQAISSFATMFLTLVYYLKFGIFNNIKVELKHKLHSKIC